MKRVVAALLAAGLLTSVSATPARILGMGKQDAFFMDEMSIFRNPANISVYPNMLMGSYGEYRVLPSDTASGGSNNYAALKRTNRDPRHPYFGAIFTYSLQQSSEAGNQYPMISVGGFFNRKDDALAYLVDDSSLVPEPLGKVDLMCSYAFPNGGMVGIGGYIAHQSIEDNNNVTQAGVYKTNLGLNWPVARSMDLEANMGLALLRSIGIDTSGIDSYDTIAGPGDMVFNANVRLFSALSVINGDFVPQAGLKFFNLYDGDVSKVNVNGGVGVNINIDKGFFWAGIEGLYNKTFLTDEDGLEEIGGRVSFGIERNIIWDWFLIRVGGMKTFMHTTENNTRAWKENPEHDADDDLVGLGFGVNIENRLKLDILVAEDVQNTFTNLVSGPQHHLFTRIDATFSF